MQFALSPGLGLSELQSACIDPFCRFREERCTPGVLPAARPSSARGLAPSESLPAGPGDGVSTCREPGRRCGLLAGARREAPPCPSSRRCLKRVALRPLTMRVFARLRARDNARRAPGRCARCGARRQVRPATVSRCAPRVAAPSARATDPGKRRQETRRPSRRSHRAAWKNVARAPGQR